MIHQHNVVLGKGNKAQKRTAIEATKQSAEDFWRSYLLILVWRPIWWPGKSGSASLPTAKLNGCHVNVPKKDNHENATGPSGVLPTEAFPTYKL